MKNRWYKNWGNIYVSEKKKIKHQTTNAVRKFMQLHKHLYMSEKKEKGRSLCIVGSHSTRQRSIEIDVLHGRPVLAAVSEEVGEVLGGGFALLLRLGDLGLALAEIFDILRNAGLQVTRRQTQNATDFCRDPVGVGMHVVHFRQAVGQLARKTRRKGARDARKHITGSQCGCCNQLAYSLS